MRPTTARMDSTEDTTAAVATQEVQEKETCVPGPSRSSESSPGEHTASSESGSASKSNAQTSDGGDDASDQPEQGTTQKSEANSDKKVKPQGTMLLPLTKVKEMMREDANGKSVRTDAAVVVQHALTHFIRMLAASHGKKALRYDHLFDLVFESPQLQFLKDYFPERVKYGEIKDQYPLQQAAQEEPEEEEEEEEEDDDDDEEKEDEDEDEDEDEEEDDEEEEEEEEEEDDDDEDDADGDDADGDDADGDDGDEDGDGNDKDEDEEDGTDEEGNGSPNSSNDREGNSEHEEGHDE